MAQILFVIALVLGGAALGPLLKQVHCTALGAAAQADDALWQELHAEFSEPELVELGYWIGFTFGGQRWLKTLSTKQGEYAASLKAKG